MNTFVGSLALLTRRSFVEGLFGSLGLTGRSPAIPGSDSLPALPEIPYETRQGWIFDAAFIGLDGRHFGIDVWSYRQWAETPVEERPTGAAELRGFGYIAIRRVSRQEALAKDPTPQPTPVDVDLRQYGDERALLIRHWRPEDPQHCRLCESCNACPSAQHPGYKLCTVGAPAWLSEEAAALYEDDGGGLRG